MSDLRYTLRAVGRQPLFFFAVVATFALGIGANTAIFSVADAVLLKGLPYWDASRLVSIRELNPTRSISEGTVSPATFLDWNSGSRSFDDMAAITGFFARVRLDDEPELLFGMSVTPNYFSVLGVSARTGTTFSQAEDPSDEDVVVLSSAFWERQFGASPDSIGATIELNGRPHKIIGVMTPEFVNARDDYKPPSFWVPMRMTYDSRSRRGPLAVIARLAPGITVEQADSDINLIEASLQQSGQESEPGWKARITPVRDLFVGKTRYAIYVLAGAVGLLLLIACVNISSLLLSRSVTRQREIAIRMAIGAPRHRIARQLLTESLCLSLIGGAIGVALSHLCLKVVLAVAPSTIPRFQEIRLDLRALVFTVLASSLAGVAAGLIPALLSSRQELSGALKDTGVGVSEEPTSKRLRYSLASAEIALSLMLLISAGLFAKSLIRLQEIDLGFEPDRMLVGMLALPQSSYRSDAQVASFYRELVSRMSVLPGVSGAAAASEPPLAGGDMLIEFTKGRAATNDGEKQLADSRRITPEYFTAVGIPLLAGRLFDASDKWGSQRVVIINRTMARRYWPDEDPIGQEIEIDKSILSVVGVVGDVKNVSLISQPYPQLYFPYTQMTARSMMLLVRTIGEPSSLLPAVRTTVRDMDREQVLTNITTLSDSLAAETAAPRLNTMLIGLFTAVSIVIAAVGVYGVISYSISQRTTEIGIRMALGASYTGIFALVVRQGLTVVVTGVFFGLCGACIAARMFSTLLFEVTPNDLSVVVAGTVLIAVISLAATCIPALKAARLDPLNALRFQ